MRGGPETMGSAGVKGAKTVLLRVAGLLLLTGLLYGIEHTVDKGGGLLSSESFCDFNRFVNGNLGRNIVLKE